MRDAIARPPSRRTPLLAGTGLLALAVGLSFVPFSATAQSPPASSPNTAAPTAQSAEPQWPKTLQKAAPTTQTTWSQPEVEVALARCAQVLKGLDIVAIPVPSFRQGECGAAAPVELVSVGTAPQIAFSPTVFVTCEMAAATHTWLTQHVQPEARRLLGAPVIRIETMSSYSCRNAYGRTKSRLSEHGRANAIDIRSFQTDRSDEADLLADWGPTRRDALAAEAAQRAAVAKAEAVKLQAERTTAGQVNKPAGPQIVPPLAPSLAAAPPRIPPPPEKDIKAATTDTIVLPRPTITVGPASIAIPFPGSNGATGLTNALGSPPNRLGGPKAKVGVSTSSKSQFLRSIHVSACRIFGTVLGPEANEAHRNHFHIDMATRRSGAFCE
jgi:hypothetical protein